MNQTLHVQLSSGEGALIRALGLIERRGFRINTCSVDAADGSVRAMQVNVTSSRPGDLLKRQLERLHDVLHVELNPVAETTKHKPGIRPVSRRQ